MAKLELHSYDLPATFDELVEVVTAAFGQKKTVRLRMIDGDDRESGWLEFWSGESKEDEPCSEQAHAS